MQHTYSLIRRSLAWLWAAGFALLAASLLLASPTAAAVATDTRTLDHWKAQFGFPLQQATERLVDFRHRANVVVFYNRNELGLGRELGCGVNSVGAVACFVTNYGSPFSDLSPLPDAFAGRNPSNTLAIVYDPPTSSGQLQLATFDANGILSQGVAAEYWKGIVKPVCIRCRSVMFELPDFAHVEYAYADQESALRAISQLMATTNRAILAAGVR